MVEVGVGCVAVGCVDVGLVDVGCVDVGFVVEGCVVVDVFSPQPANKMMTNKIRMIEINPFFNLLPPF